MIILHTEQPQVWPNHFLNNVLKLFKVRAPFVSWGNEASDLIPLVVVRFRGWINLLSSLRL